MSITFLRISTFIRISNQLCHKQKPIFWIAQVFSSITTENGDLLLCARIDIFLRLLHKTQFCEKDEFLETTLAE